MTDNKQEARIQTEPQDTTIPIVGIGASAGGLQALELFLRNTPSDCGLAFIIVQHMDPNYDGMMVELLGRATHMPVAQITDGMRIEPDHVYVIPPNRDLSLLQGVLHLQKPVESRGLRLPIDHFFRTLADDQQERSIGLILSGMGSDGTLGLRAIKEKAGAVFVQDPASAQFDGMPRSAIDAGLADVVAPAEELAGRIIGYMQHVPQFFPRPDLGYADKNRSNLGKIILLLRVKTGHDFSLYKKSTLYRRIERRMGLHQLNKIADYVEYLRSSPQEVELLFKELLIGVTSFFRDPAMWEQLKVEVIPALLAAHAKRGPLRAWVTACSTGEEAYSLAIVFREVLEQLAPASDHTLQIFATDLDKDAIDKARTGFFPANIAADVSEERLRRFFIKGGNGYQVSKEIREMVIFAPQNLVSDPPFTKLDLLTCRNLLIYLEPELQKKLVLFFHYSLNEGGVLALGGAETVSQSSNLFDPLPGKNRLYQRKHGLERKFLELPATVPRHEGDDPHSSSPPSLLTAPNLPALTDELLLRQFTPAAVLTTHHGDIVYLSAKTGKYLEPSVGKANMNIFAMAREGLAGPLSEAFAKADREQAAVISSDVQIAADGGVLTVELTVQPLSKPAALRGMVLVVFRDVREPPAGKAKTSGKSRRAAKGEVRLTELTKELQYCHEELQTTREEMQASQEELKSANEELQSTNEELQSTNEELTTSKEEMQSMNEELRTVNYELTTKVDELSRIRDDMENLLNSTEIATLFLDDQLKVRRFTSQTTGIFKLIPGDTGRPITDQVTSLDYPEFAEDVRKVLRSLSFRERQVSDHDGRWFSVRIMPYQTQDKRIDGVVITFVDISESKILEATMNKAFAVLQTRYDDQSEELKAARDVADMLRKAKAVLENRFKGQELELRQVRADLAEERRNTDETEPGT